RSRRSPASRRAWRRPSSPAARTRARATWSTAASSRSASTIGSRTRSRSRMPAEAVDLGTLLPTWSAVPFAGMLLSIALFPLVAPAFWHHHFPKVTAAWSVALLVPFVLRFRGAALHELTHTAVVDYVPFIILLATLFTIGGGIHVRGSLRGS